MRLSLLETMKKQWTIIACSNKLWAHVDDTLRILMIMTQKYELEN